jgi:hypothetical protein
MKTLHAKSPQANTADAEIILRALRTARDHSQAFVFEFKAKGLDASMYHQEEERLQLYNAALKAYAALNRKEASPE